MKNLLPFIFILLITASCRKERQTDFGNNHRQTSDYSGEGLRHYYDLMCRVAKSTPGFFPPQVARAYGYVGVTSYEAVVNGIPHGRSLAGQLNGLPANALPKPMPGTAYNWALVSNAAVADMMRMMFESTSSANKGAIDSLERANLDNMRGADELTVIERSVQFGKDIAKAVYNYSLTDGGDKAYIDPFQLPYTPPSDPSCWSPTGTVTHPIAPYWGNNRPFLQANVSGTQTFAPCAFGTATSCTFYNEGMQVYNQVKNNTPEQIEIAKYWADDPFNTCTPTGHTFNIMTQLLQDENATLAKTSVAYARLSIAENDAFIACWKQKYKYTLVRPVTYIKQNIDPDFKTVIGTPPFPAFVSGHSAEIGAGAKVFTDMFSDGSGNHTFTDYSQLQYGFPARTYSNFNDMARQCADSRFYGGIHYPMDNEQGLVQGHIVGDNVNHMLAWPSGVR